MDLNPIPETPLYLDKANPAVWKAYGAVAQAVREATDAAGLGRELVELMNVRISQINGCAYCLDLHTRLAAEAGASAQKLGVLSAWRSVGLFGELERAALAVGEAVTRLPGEEQLHAEVAAARVILTDEQYSALSWAALSMNAFNRVSIVSRHPVRPRTA